MLLSFILLALTNPAQATGAGAPCPNEQIHFSAADDRVNCPIAIPDDVAAILRSDPDISRHLQNGTLPATWFSATEVHLAGKTERDIIVMAAGPLRTADATTFWVFRPTAQGHELILTATARDLILTHKRDGDYRIIETDSRSSTHRRTARYRFEGRHYTVFEDTGWL